MSRMLTCDPVRPDISVIDEIAAALTDNSVVVMPTETQYSLSVRGDREDAPQKICAVKKRPEVVKAALFVKDLEMAQQVCTVGRAAEILASRFLPGPLTLVMPVRKDQKAVAPGFVSEDGIGIRISSSPLVRAVMDRLPFAVTATSANLSGQMTLDTAIEIKEALGETVNLYVDAGPCRGLIPSTVVKVGEEVTVLRHGIIPEAEIRRCLEEEKQ